MAARRTEARGSARVTIDHDEIRNWVEEHGGHPAAVKRTRGRGGPGILRVDFPGFSGEDSLEEVAWEEFFERFEEAGLAFLYQDKTSAGRPSRFNKLVARESVGLSSPRRRGAAPRDGARAQSAGSGARPRKTGPRQAPRRKTKTKAKTKSVRSSTSR